MQMIAPRDIYELADTVDAELLAQEGADLEQVKDSWMVFTDYELVLQCQHVQQQKIFSIILFRN